MRKLFVIIIGSFLLCSVAAAQQTQTGSISGIVTLEDGEPLPGVIVTATADVLPKARSTVTDAVGDYRFVALPPGAYELAFAMPGFATEKRNFPVHLQQKAIINVEMKDAQFEGEIIVTAETPTIDTTSAEIKASIPAEVIQALPVGQQYRDLIKLIPGVQYTEDTTRGPSAGGSGQDNVYEFDGVSVTLPLFGTLSAEPASHDIEELAVVKGGANAIGFNRSGGLLVNTLSKSGTNQFRGELSYQIQNAGMTGALVEETEAVYEQDKDWLVANLGGPIIPEMLYFYASYYRPTTARANRANLYGDVPDSEVIRDEVFAKLTFTPTDSLMFSGSYRDSETDASGYGVTAEATAGTASYGSDSTLRITVLEGTWVVTDNSLLSFKYSDFAQKGSARPDLVFPFDISSDGSVGLDVDNLDQQGRLYVPMPVDGQDEYNAFIAPIIDEYGYLEGGVRMGGGIVGGYYYFNDQDFFNESFEAGYDHYIGNHEFHIGYQWSRGEEDVYRTSNGWGNISVIGGRDTTADGEPVYYEARFFQTSLIDDGEALIDPIHSEIVTHNIELNDVIRMKDWTFNVGLIFSNDLLYGQGLREVSGNVSGFELAPGNKYLMKEVGFDEMISPRLGATWSPNGKDALYASYARYYPAASSLPRAASWARNLMREIDAQFDADGNLIGMDPLRASSGKFFQEGIKPRSIDEFVVGYDKQISSAWTGRVFARHRKGQDFWEDTNNNARSRFEPPPGVPTEDYIPNLQDMRDEVFGSSYVIAALDGAYTKYYEVSTEAEWRGRNAFFRGSYVWSHYYGNFDQDNTTTGNDADIFVGSSYLADGAGRQIWDFREGNLRGDRRHMLKAYGYYQLPWNGIIGAFGVYQSGQPWEMWNVEVYRHLTGSSSDTSRYAEPAGSRTTDAHYQLDLSYTQDFPLGNRFNIQLRGEVFNVTDNQTGYNIQNKFNSAGFGDPRDYYDPQRFQLTVAFQF